MGLFNKLSNRVQVTHIKKETSSNEIPRGLVEEELIFGELGNIAEDLEDLNDLSAYSVDDANKEFNNTVKKEGISNIDIPECPNKDEMHDLGQKNAEIELPGSSHQNDDITAEVMADNA